MSLSGWLKNGWLIEHKTSRQEIKHLLRLVDRDLVDCRNSTLSHAGAVTAIELVEMSVLAGNLRKSVEAWIVAKFPALRA